MSDASGPSSAGNGTGESRVRKRALEACTSCRRRKTKCNSARPACANCETHGTACIYEPIVNTGRPRGRPSKAARLEGPSEPERTVPTTARTPARPPPDTDLRRASVSRMIVSANGVSSYHGRTSTLFEESSHDRAEIQPKMPEEWIEKGLIAEAARQRQLEDVNYRLGKLDFDGIDPELGMHLLSLHWNRQHHSFLITYRPAFMRDMASNGPYFSKLLLNAIYFGSSKFSPRREVRRDVEDVRTAGWKFRERVRELLGGALDKSEITTIQALLVMTNSLFALGDERSAAWLYAGLAFRMIVDLGMHVDTPDLASIRKFSDEDFEIRRRVFWAAFVVDKIQSLYQGRPVTIKESDTLVPIKFLDTYEELEHWTPFAYSTQSTSPISGGPAYSVSTFRYLCQLSAILGDVLSIIYTERSFHKSGGELSDKLESVHNRLTTWHRDLPPHLVVDIKNNSFPSIIPPPHVLSLHAMYNVVMILLHRPFVADGHLYSTARAITVNSFMVCATAANNIVSLLRAYDKAFSVRRAPYLISYATYVAATIHARIAAKRDQNSDAHNSLETCLSVFRENQETNWAVRRANAIIQNLMKRLGVSVSTPEELHIDKNITAGLQDSTTDPTQEDSNLHSLDIDGIIQSFVREHENAQYVGQPQQAPSTNMVTTAQAPTVDGVNNAFSGTMPNYDPQNLAYDQSGMWGFEGPYDAPLTVDDLLYGFNGSPLDTFRILEWDT